jgi:hypothetical protein
LLRKLSLCLLFSAGLFVMVAATIRVIFVYTVSTINKTPEYGNHEICTYTMLTIKAANALVSAIWSCRETFVAFCVTNVPIIRPMFNKRFWTKGHSSTDNASGGRQYHQQSGSMELKGNKYTISSSSDRSRGKNKRSRRDSGKDVMKITVTSDSTEHIVSSDDDVGTTSPGLAIQIHKTVEISSANTGFHPSDSQPGRLDSQERHGRYVNYSAEVGR